MRKEIYGVRQKSGETLHEYWEKFKRLYAICPYYKISNQLLIQHFFEGLLPMDRSMVVVASSGASVVKNPNVLRNPIENVASNTQQFGTRMEDQSRIVNKVNTSFVDQHIVENRLEDLTSLVKKLAIRQ